MFTHNHIVESSCYYKILVKKIKEKLIYKYLNKLNNLCFLKKIEFV